jgi:hypothetical protein
MAPVHGFCDSANGRPVTASSYPSGDGLTRGTAIPAIAEREALRRDPDFFDLRAEPEPTRKKLPAPDAYTERQIKAAKYIVAASRKRGRRQKGERASLASAVPATPTSPFAQPTRSTGPAWAEQLQHELVATTEQMRVAQLQLTQERSLRMAALKNKERAELEARLARKAAVESTRDQQDSERKMLISASGMRTQREQLQEELTRLTEQQQALEDELNMERDRAARAEEQAQRALESARESLQEKEQEYEKRVADAQGERLEQQRKARALAHDVEEQKRLLDEKLNAEKEKRIAHTQEMAIRRIGKRDLTRGWVEWHSQASAHGEPKAP